MLAALVIGVALGFLVGGRPANLAAIRLRWVPLALVGLVLQVLLFSTPLGDVLVAGADWTAPAVYVGSTVLVLLVVLRNVSVPAIGTPGLVVVAAGSLANLAAIVANGGYMPTTMDALAVSGTVVGGGYTNSIVLDEPALLVLTDLFAIPSGFPFASVFSAGDAMIALGIVSAIVLGMRHRPATEGAAPLAGDEAPVPHESASAGSAPA